MIDISKILAGWISSWVENDLGGFRLGGKWLKVWVDSGGWKTAGGKRLGGFWMGGFRLQGHRKSLISINMLSRKYVTDISIFSPLLKLQKKITMRQKQKLVTEICNFHSKLFHNSKFMENCNKYQ